jgi:hypothetical protein
MKIKTFDIRTGEFTERELTKEEITAMEAEARLANIEQSRKPLTEAEVLAMLIPMQINTLVVDDNTAFRMSAFYPSWEVNTHYPVGYKVQSNGKLYKVIQEHTSVEGWQPTQAASLFTEINETFSGVIDDPIPYSGNMALEKDKHYIEESVIYLCVRDTISPVYNKLSELAGIYVEAV